MKTVRGDYLGGIVEAKQVLGADANVMRKKAALLYNKLEASKSGLMRTVGSKNNHNAAENLRELEMFEHQFSRNETIRKDMELTAWKLAKVWKTSIGYLVMTHVQWVPTPSGIKPFETSFLDSL